MGEEISKVHFEERDFVEFRQRMASELALLRQWEQGKRFHCGELTAGLELEAWLLDPAGLPAPDNGQFLESLSRESVVPELAKFNFELNVQPQKVSGLGLLRMQQELLSTWQLCGEVASHLNLRITCIGTLPTVTQEMLCAQNMTPRFRFAALNRQVFRLRRGQPLALKIDGIDLLRARHADVMLEAAATSLQVHLKVPLAKASRYFNAFVIASSATVAVAANAALLFGKRLWHDSRIPIFEQAVDTGHALRRVSFGDAYAAEDFLSLLEDTARDFPALLPVTLPESIEKVPHLRLQRNRVALESAADWFRVGRRAACAHRASRHVGGADGGRYVCQYGFGTRAGACVGQRTIAPGEPARFRRSQTQFLRRRESWSRRTGHMAGSRVDAA